MSNNNGNSNTKLSYFIAEQKGIVIISFIGPLKGEHIGVLEECCHKIEGMTTARWVVFNFRDVPAGMDKKLHAIFVQMQKLARQKPADVRLSAIQPQLRAHFVNNGLVRSDELTNNLAEALQSLPIPMAA